MADAVSYMQAAVQMKGMPDPRTVEVYYDLLKDLDYRTVIMAVKQALLNHPYPTLPPVGAIRQAAVAIGQPTISAGEAWRMFREAVSIHGERQRRLMRGGEFVNVGGPEAGLASLPRVVARAARAFGWQAMCDVLPGEVGYAQARFEKVYAECVKEDADALVMLPEVRQTIAAIGQGIGEMPKLEGGKS